MKFFNILIRICFFIFLILGTYYLSLSVHAFLQIKDFNQESEQFLEYTNDDQGEYCYKKSIIFSAARGLYQTQTARLFICLNKNENSIKLQSFSGKILRDSCEQIQEFDFNYSNLTKTVNSSAMLAEYIVYRVNNDTVRFYLGNNNIAVKIKGFMLNNPDQDVKVMIANSNHKGTTIPLQFLLNAIANFSIVLILYIVIFIMKKIRKKLENKAIRRVDI